MRVLPFLGIILAGSLSTAVFAETAPANTTVPKVSAAKQKLIDSIKEAAEKKGIKLSDAQVATLTAAAETALAKAKPGEAVALTVNGQPIVALKSSSEGLVTAPTSAVTQVIAAKVDGANVSVSAPTPVSAPKTDAPKTTGGTETPKKQDDTTKPTTKTEAPKTGGDSSSTGGNGNAGPSSGGFTPAAGTSPSTSPVSSK